MMRVHIYIIVLFEFNTNYLSVIGVYYIPGLNELNNYVHNNNRCVQLSKCLIFKYVYLFNLFCSQPVLTYKRLI